MRLERTVRPARRSVGLPARATPVFPDAEGWIPSCARDGQTMRPDGLPAQTLIDGVTVHEARHVIKGEGLLTEIFRRDWGLDDGVVDQVFEVRLAPDEVSAWHVHRFTRDRLYVTHGTARIVLYDARTGASSHGRVNEFRFGSRRPALLGVPPGVWHGVQNLRRGPSRVLNLVDKAYSYAEPDHWRLPADAPEIPYRFALPPR